MKKTTIISLALAGLTGPAISDTVLPNDQSNIVSTDDVKSKLSRFFERDLPYTLAGHSSHASHGSHSAHSSHSSSYQYHTDETEDRYKDVSDSENKFTPPPNLNSLVNANYIDGRNTNSTPSKSILPSSPKIADKKSIKGTTKDYGKILLKVQLHLYATGYYSGMINGSMDIETKSAIVSFQKKNGIDVTGQLSDALLKKINISS
jgi:His-Xaa-Ser repeat protein HxsA